MTCGVCSPEAFRPKKGKRVWGYLTASEMHAATAQARKLYFMGAETVLSDAPAEPLAERPGWQVLADPVMLRDGDCLILSKTDDLSTDPAEAEAHIDALSRRGVAVSVLKPDFFADNEP